LSCAGFISSACSNTTKCRTDWRDTLLNVQLYLAKEYSFLAVVAAGTYEEGKAYFLARTTSPMIAILVTFILWIISDVASLYFLWCKEDVYEGSNWTENSGEQQARAGGGGNREWLNAQESPVVFAALEAGPKD
jgi:hypothetical protein